MRAGDVVGPYILRREIGEGGIAHVFLGEHSVNSGGANRRELVVKALRKELLDQPQTVAIFLSEPKALQQVEHENTLEVLDVVDDGPERFFVTEMLRGRTLAELLKQGPLSLPRAIRIARQVAAVLGHAHDVDVVHRNLKPANVFLVKRDGDPDFVKLLELGAVRMSNQDDKPVPGTVIGTPAYMAPEQLRQLPGDHRVDIYSFGVLLYELAVGQRPFVGDVAYVVRQHVLEPAPKASLLASVPDVLDALIAKCLEKEPDKRPKSMHDVALVLGALAETLGKPAKAREGPPTHIAVPKNTSGYTTVSASVSVVTTAVAAPPPVITEEDDEPSFEGVTGVRESLPLLALQSSTSPGFAAAVASPAPVLLPTPPAAAPSPAPAAVAAPAAAAAAAAAPARATTAPPPSPAALDQRSIETREIERARLMPPPAHTERTTAPAAPTTATTTAPPAATSTAPPATTAGTKKPRWDLAAAAAAGAFAMWIVQTIAGGSGEDARAPVSDAGGAVAVVVDAGAVGGAKPVETKPPRNGDVNGKPVQPKALDVKPVETKPVETKPVETKPVETKPVEQPPPATAPVSDKVKVPFGSNPAGAQVWIRMDNRIRLLCNTPCTFTLPTGKEVLVELKVDGYASYQRTFIVAEGTKIFGTLRAK